MEECNLKNGSCSSSSAYFNRVVVTMTSWVRRIDNVKHVLECLMNQTRMPDIVYLNLSVEEFPGREDDLPEELVELIKDRSDTIRLNWVVGSNTKTFKKVFPVLPYLEDDDLIVIVDDDMEIPEGFLELRVADFTDCQGKFAISGVNNPKWHTDKKTHCNVTFNVIGPSSCFTKRMLAGWERYATRPEIVETFNDDCTYTILILMNGYRIVPSWRIGNKTSVTDLKITGYNENDRAGKSGVYQRDWFVWRAFEKAYPILNFGHPLRDSLFNLVIADNVNSAGDNGEYFYRRMREVRPDVKMTFVISRKCRDWNRLEADGFNLVDCDSPGLETLLKGASWILFSNRINMSEKFKEKCVFLQHGVLNLLNLGSENYMRNSIFGNMAHVVVTNNPIEIGLASKWSDYNFRKILATGLPRHDLLLEKDETRRSSPDHQKSVFISFHWRWDLRDMEKFKDSRYLYDVKRLLADSRWRELSDSGVKIRFLPHHCFMDRIELFEVPDFMEMPLDTPFQDILVDSDVLVTDRSSNFLEMAYMDRISLIHPIGHLKVLKEDLRNYPSARLVVNADDVFKGIEYALNHNPVKGLAERTFVRVDRNNSLRLFETLRAESDEIDGISSAN